MKNCLGLLMGVLLVGVPLAWADPQPAVLNDPPAAVSLLTKLLEKLDLSYETKWSWRAGEFSQGGSASLYDFKPNGVHLASARLGFSTGSTLYAGPGLDLPGLASLLPNTIKGVATVEPLNVLWSLIGKHARVMPYGGYTWNSKNRFDYGMTFGAAWGF